MEHPENFSGKYCIIPAEIDIKQQVVFLVLSNHIDLETREVKISQQDIVDELEPFKFSRRFIRAKNKFKEYTGSGKVEEKNVFPDPTNEDFISGLTEREKTILKLRSKGTTYKEISKRTGTSISYAQQTWKRIQGKYRIYLLEK